MVAVLMSPAIAVAAPNWSGLDARNYSGTIGAHGTLISSVPLDPALSVPSAAASYRVLYATIDQHDAPAVATAVVFTPRTPAPPGGWPVIAWAHGTVGLGDDCAPSANPRSERDKEYLSHWLDQGYAVVGADYTGLGTPGLMSYLNSRATAQSVVDSVIAAHQLDLDLSPKWAVVGQSQGGGAAVATARWATELSAGSGLDYRGVVATGTPAGVERMVKTAGPDMAAPANLAPVANAYAAYILAALREAHPELNVNSALTPAGAAAADRAETVCLRPLSDELSGMTIPGLFSAPLSSLPNFAAVVDDFMGIPSSGYDRPIFLGVGMLDRDVPPELTLKFNDALVANGQPVTLHVYPDQDHSGTVMASVPDSTPFLAGLFG
ncbi:alpha/beta hydrolase family protein [Mycolicibacterium brumae]|uniref:Alpha/beta hydrolase n=1 Tax=Mycolicibacterium brumae TaxID=85968 RepID=A0A2G5PDV1_9MYCO|nr:prolyl oligopeptidase family serine peptidase [Mycolicibacterium brumae]MCV7193525.1 prolyl oligopeptidase family serine peptidase [Mycolicibacterium brumae]PIB76203.1 alpha/beta hydrolase [Mycolicibacterium brumae]UWW09202.1 prolyl oligopeptidase family serine peptidase [Mycolicibacterium brumae]